MKAVACSDLHLGIGVFNERIQIMLDSFADQLLNDVHPNVFICLGDVFHTKKPSADVIEFATKWFKRLADNIPHVLILPGNHDVDAFSDITAVDFLDDIASNIEIIYEPTATMDFLFVPYHRVVTADLRKQIRAYPQVFLHQGFSEAFMYGNTRYGAKTDALTMDDLDNKDLVLLGHIHAPYAVPEKHIIGLGAPYQLRYADVLTKRGFACWDMTNPLSIELLEYKSNFYLSSVNIALPASDNVVEELIKALPSPADYYYYRFDVTLEGRLTRTALHEEIRKAIVDVFEGWRVDGINIVNTLPQKERTFYTQLKAASSMKEVATAPQEMLSVYMDSTQGNYFKANPVLRQGIAAEFSDVVRAVSEAGR